MAETKTRQFVGHFCFWKSNAHKKGFGCKSLEETLNLHVIPEDCHTYLLQYDKRLSRCANPHNVCYYAYHQHPIYGSNSLNPQHHRRRTAGLALRSWNADFWSRVLLLRKRIPDQNEDELGLGTLSEL